MFSLTSQERKALFLVGALLILGALLYYLPRKEISFLLREEGEVSFFGRRKVNINKAGLKELMSLPQIGEVIAKRIISYRKKKGPFQNIEELRKIKGIGDKKIKIIKDFISLN